MRRPINWIVVSLSLLLLLVRHTLLEPAPGVSLAHASVMPEASPFAYVREDGSLLHLPMQASASSSEWLFEDANAAGGMALPREPANLEAAVYHWSTPAWLVPLPQDGRTIYPHAGVISAAPSWR
jgi:hypothetical protein